MTTPPRVSAVVLSMGEPTLARALDSVANQSLAFADVVTIEGVAPFHRALNAGASRVATEHFLQVDADMVLDPDCVERLSACLQPSVGAVIGMLRDPLCGRVEAIKLFRTEAFRDGGFPDSVSPDTDFLERLRERGAFTVYALRHERANPIEWHTFGEHRPGYEPLYTFEKHKRDGRRLRYRGDASSIPYHLDVLHRSRHPLALLAEVALANGLFLDWEGDQQRPIVEGEDFRFSSAFLHACDGWRAERFVLPGVLLSTTPATAFRRAYQRGARQAERREARRFAAELDALHRLRHPWAWMMQIGLCRGLVAGHVAGAALAADWRRIEPLTREERPSTILGRAGARAIEALRRRLRAIRRRD